MASRALSTRPEEVVFGRYRLLDVIGEGGMAVVYDALIDGPRGFARRCVVKRIRPELSSDPYFVDMLATEARLCGLLRHANIVQTFDFGEVNGELYLAMEHVDGFDLATVLGAAHKVRRLPSPGVIAYVAYELARALAYAHALCDDAGNPLEIVHRDVSPSNVMLSEEGGVKLLDFGIAKATSRVRDEHTRTGTLKGKLGYMSPEQAEGHPIDRRSDIFALGVVAYELLTLRRLFKGENDLATLRLIRETRVTAPSKIAGAGDAELDSILLKMLARAPGDRFQSCEDVVSALEPLARRLHGDAGATREYLREIAPKRSVPPAKVAAPSLDRSSGENAVRSDDAVRTEPSRLQRYLVIAAGIAGLGLAATLVERVVGHWAASGAVAVAAAPAERRPAVAPVAAPPPVAEVPATAEPAALVDLRVGGRVGAEVYVDQQLVGHVPVDTQLPRRPAHARQVSVTLPGYDRWTRSIAGDANVVLSVHLRKTSLAKHVERPSQETPVIKDPFR